LRESHFGARERYQKASNGGDLGCGGHRHSPFERWIEVV
jgi:hypothetical protein